MFSASAVVLAGMFAAANVPTVLTVQDAHITESSGLVRSVAHPNLLWTHNDGGSKALIYGIDPAGRTVARITLRGIDPFDPEALSRGVDGDGAPALFLGDIGDNERNRPNISVFRVTEPSALGRHTLKATWFRFTYEDGPHDAEALLVSPQDGRIWVATKSAGKAGLYRAPRSLVEKSHGSNVLRRVATVPSLVTDGAFLPGGRFVLRTYTSAFLYDRPGKLRQELALPIQPQGESIAFDRDRLLVGSEGVHSKIEAVALPAALGGASPSPSAKGTASRESRLSTTDLAALKALAAVLVGAVVMSFLVFAIARRFRDR